MNNIEALEKMTWDEIYNAAIDHGYGDAELTRKDKARYEICGWCADNLGYNPEELYENGFIDSVEEELDDLDSKYHFIFTEDGTLCNTQNGSDF